MFNLIKKIFKYGIISIVVITILSIVTTILISIIEGYNDAKNGVSEKNNIGIEKKNKDYIGNWSGTGITFNISKDGFLDYEKKDGIISKSVNGPISSILSNKITVTILFKDIDFIINKKPYINGGNYEMVIDGNLLKRKNYDLIIPNDLELEKLVSSTISDFIKGVKNKNFDLFYKNLSELWKNETDLKEINNIFKVFFDSDIDFNIFLGKKIIFTNKPYLDDNKILNLEGYILSNNIKLKLKLKYTYEYPKWKLIGIFIN